MEKAVASKSMTARKLRDRFPAVKSLIRSWQLYVLLALPLLYLVVFRYVPMYGAQIAFKKFVITKGIWESEWVGLQHFIRFLNHPKFQEVLGNTIVLSLYQLAATFPLPIMLALGLNYVGSKWYKKTVQMVTYAPHFISVVVMSGIIIQFLSPSTGAVNNLLRLVGIEPINFLAKAEWFSSIYVWSDVWQNMGFACIIYLAALASIDPGLHEAAVVDGASKLRRLWHIDLPGILPIAIIILILNMGNILDLGFEKALLLQNNLNLRSSEIIDTYVYKIGLTSAVQNFDYAAAIGLFKNAIAMILLVSVNQAARRYGQSSLW
ncbi:ABC transporter permease [Paenibacillus sp. 1P07SE]|uniref:ABC transporter permease n=1 Tax=Paenibacillus sp. 1P07SE TaxID=3132209 RepID=UPI0039A59EAC